MHPLIFSFLLCHQGCLIEGLDPPSSKKLFVRGALKLSQVLNCERLDYRAEILKLGGISSDLMVERRYFQIIFS